MQPRDATEPQQRSTGQVISEPLFLDSSAGRLFAVHHRPAIAAATRGQVLFVPPFNEEMNRCRSMVTLQAQALAGLGLGTLVVDLVGTGDSEGDFGDARWALWQQDLRAAKEWLDHQPGGCRVLWGLRLGAILAADLHAETADPAVALVLWQAVADGKTHLTQFFRVRIAAQMDRADLPKETTASMREALAAGQSVEVAGYEIHPELAAAIDAAKLGDHPVAAGSRILWLENANGDNPTLAPASQSLLARWPGPAAAVDADTFAGPAFWQVHERVHAPDVVAQTTAWLQAWTETA
jgi:exosortase A-associated hydrolase 2